MCFLDLKWTKLENLNRLLLQCQKYQLIKLLLKEGPCYGILTKTKKGIVLHLIGFYYILIYVSFPWQPNCNSEKVKKYQIYTAQCVMNAASPPLKQSFLETADEGSVEKLANSRQDVD